MFHMAPRNGAHNFESVGVCPLISGMSPLMFLDGDLIVRVFWEECLEVLFLR